MVLQDLPVGLQDLVVDLLLEDAHQELLLPGMSAEKKIQKKSIDWKKSFGVRCWWDRKLPQKSLTFSVLSQATSPTGYWSSCTSFSSDHCWCHDCSAGSCQSCQLLQLHDHCCHADLPYQSSLLSSQDWYLWSLSHPWPSCEPHCLFIVKTFEPSKGCEPKK